MKQALTVVSVLALWVGMVWAQAPQGAAAGQQQGATPQGAAAAQAGRGRGRGAITPRILRFEATSAAIKPGESIVLSWATEAGTPSIDNGIGAVGAASGTAIGGCADQSARKPRTCAAGIGRATRKPCIESQP